MPKILFLTTLPFYPDASGGSERSSIYLFQSLREIGWQIEVMCKLSLHSPYFRHGCWQSLKRLQKPPLSMVDTDLGYPCWRQVSKFSKEHQWVECLDRKLHEYQPDIVLSHSIQYPRTYSLLNYAARQGYPVFCFIRWLSRAMEAGIEESGATLPKEFHLIANSPFTASTIAKLTQNPVGVVLPFIDLDQYRVTRRERRYITFVNPVPPKGLDVAIEIARRLPQERFLFIKGKWGHYSASEIEAFLKPIYKLPNVEVWNHQQDMRHVYSVTDILLVPSRFTETFGRVILEAQVNGIPVVAANVGGIPYALGQGGILVESRDRPEGYVDALRQLRTEENFYAELSALAFENSQRPEFDAQSQVKRFVHFIEDRIKVTA